MLDNPMGYLFEETRKKHKKTSKAVSTLRRRNWRTQSLGLVHTSDRKRRLFVFVCAANILKTELSENDGAITGGGSRAQDVAAALYRFSIETNRQWKHVLSALASTSSIQIEMVLATVF